uniref:Putative secreted peptide n=1 Tax=Anopheles braziliensis TaxID=58242 RepID=A0A2M3ZXQ3_9DIPT
MSWRFRHIVFFYFLSVSAFPVKCSETRCRHWCRPDVCWLNSFWSFGPRAQPVEQLIDRKLAKTIGGRL